MPNMIRIDLGWLRLTQNSNSHPKFCGGESNGVEWCCRHGPVWSLHWWCASTKTQKSEIWPPPKDVCNYAVFSSNHIFQINTSCAFRPHTRNKKTRKHQLTTCSPPPPHHNHHHRDVANGKCSVNHSYTNTEGRTGIVKVWSFARAFGVSLFLRQGRSMYRKASNKLVTPAMPSSTSPSSLAAAGKFDKGPTASFVDLHWVPAVLPSNAKQLVSWVWSQLRETHCPAVVLSSCG